MNKMVDWVAFDLDGTLLNDTREVSERDIKKLCELGKKNILRIAATGRNLYSLCKVLPANFPMDFAVFSSGAGILNWKTKEIIRHYHLTEKNARAIIAVLMRFDLNFSVHKAIPDNHHMLLHAPHPLADDLINYTKFYKEFVEPLNPENLPHEITQFIVLLNSHTHLVEPLNNELKAVKTILTTSPVDKKSMWLEIFHKEVSKANGLKYLSTYLNVNKPSVLGIGNDYNDLDLLEFANHSFVVDNAPDALKTRYVTVAGNNWSGFSEACQIMQI